jgi:glycosyltransferase involved in cell wall biosynthesis
MTIFFWIAAAFGVFVWLLPQIEGRLSGWRPPHLKDISPDSLDVWPALTIIVPALNEEETIGQAMRTLLQLDYPDLEIIAVNDRSTDRTGPILDSLSGEDSRLRVVHIAELPSGWLGKNHALQRAAEQARGEYILFTDADVHFDPTALRRAITLAMERNLGHLVVFPHVEMHGFWETVSVWYFGIVLVMKFRPWKVPDPKAKDAFLGIGAFNLVKTDAYWKMGGHAALPMDVADDIKLGKLMKLSGARADSAASDGMVYLRWVVGLRGIVHGLTKNMFAGYNFNPLLAIATSFAVFMFTVWPAIGLWVGPLGPRIACGFTMFLMYLAALMAPATRGKSPLYGLAFPLAGLVVIYITFRSMLFTYRQGGIKWRGTFYPLDELRRGVV